MELLQRLHVLQLISLSCCLLLAALAPLAAESTDEYPDDFFEPVDEQPEPEQEQPKGPPMLGIQMTPPPTHAQEQNGTTPDQGVYVRRVFPNTAADQMGLQPGDIILSVNGTEIDSMSRLRDVVNGSSVGDPVNVLITRDGELTSHDGSFREWLDSVRRRRLDDKAEQRYRDMQRRRAERRMQQAKEQQAAIQQKIDAHKRAHGDLAEIDDWDDINYDDHMAKELGPLPDFTLPAIQLSGAAFAFSWQVDVDSNELPVASNDQGAITPSATMQLLAAVAPAFHLHYVCNVDNNEL